MNVRVIPAPSDDSEPPIHPGDLRGTLAAFGWWRAIVSLLVLAASSFLGYQGYQRWLAEGEAAPTSAQAVPARRTSLVESVSLSGTAIAGRQAKLAFKASGNVASVFVRVGDVVKAGQSLAQLDTTQLKNAVELARISLTTSQIRLQQLVATPQAADVASADQSVTNARVQLQKAQNDLQTLQAGPTAADMATARQALLTAQNNQATAQTALDNLRGSSQLAQDVSVAQRQRADLERQLDAARQQLRAVLGRVSGPSDTVEGLTVSTGNLSGAVTRLCTDPGRQEGCSRAAAGAGDLRGLVAAILAVAGASDGGLRQALTDYERALAQLPRSAAEVDAAMLDVLRGIAATPAAESRFASLARAVAASGGQPTDQTMANATRAVASAAEAVNAAQAKLDVLLAGPTAADIQNAKNVIDSASAALATAQAKRDQLLAGPLSTDIALQQQQIRTAELGLQKATNDLQGATMVAPYDGIVGSVQINVGDPVGTSGPTIAVVDPSGVSVSGAAQESDLPRLRVGQTVRVTFDAVPNAVFQGRVSSIAPAADIVQGVATYPVIIDLVAPSGPSAAAADPGQIRVGMTATAQIEVSRRDNVVAVPSRAVRRQGREQAVEVQLAGGKTEMRVVQTGASDGQNTEIVSGLNEGDVVLIRTTGTTAAPVDSGGFGGLGGVPGPGAPPAPGGR